MKRLLVAFAAVAAVAGCSDSGGTYIPAGTWAGSTASDQAVTVVVTGNRIEVNREKGRFVDTGVFEVDDMPGRPRFACRVVGDQEEELSCEVTTTVGGRSRTTTLDLLLL